MGNDRFTRRRARRSLLGLLAVLALILAACGNADDDSAGGDSDGTTTTSSADSGESGGEAPVKLTGVPGVTDSEIHVATLGTNSNNPLGTCVLKCFGEGIKAYFAWRNSEGGVHGRKLVVTKEVDDELANNQAKALEIISANDTFATFSAAQVASGWADLAKNDIPTYVWAINMKEMSGNEEIFGNREVVCISCSSRPSAYLASVAKAKKVATLGYGVSENSKECAEGAADSIEKYSDDIGGAEAVYTNANLQFGLPNGIGPEVSAMKKEGVDFIMGCLDLNGMKTLAQELQRQGIRKDVKMAHANTYDQKFVKDAAGLFDGDIVQVSFRPFEADPGDSQLAQFNEWMEKQDFQPTEMAIDGWINADTFYEGLKAAGPDFDRKKVIDASNEKLTEFTAGALIPPIDWSRQHTAPTEDDLATNGPKQECMAAVEVVDGEFEIVGSKAKPFYCWPGENRDWVDPTQESFE